MAKEMEIFDSWVQSQKEMMDTWMRMQKDFFGMMADSARKMQEAMLCQFGVPEAEGAQKETLSRYNQMVDTMMNSTRMFTDQAMKVQDAWMEAFRRQVEVAAGVGRTFMERGWQAGPQAQPHEHHAEHGQEAA